MSEPNAAPAATDTLAVPAPTPPPPPQAITAEQAAKALGEARAKALGPPETPKDPQPRINGRFVKADETNSAPEGADAAPPPEANGETEQADPAELPPIERPQSWAKDKAELWNTAPREIQEYLSEYDKTTSSELRRRQNETAEKSKSLEAKEKAAEEARTRYEQIANDSLQMLQQQQAAEFADIKTNQDVQKLATEDPFRFIQWQARQQLLSHQYQEVQNLQRQREQERAQKFDAWSKEQDSSFEKDFPEFTDKEKSGALRASIATYLTREVGIPEEKLPEFWKTDLWRDKMAQRIVYDAYRFNKAQQDAKKAVAAPKPPVLRPGTATSKTESFEQAKDQAMERLKKSTGVAALRAGVEALRAKRKAS